MSSITLFRPGDRIVLHPSSSGRMFRGDGSYRIGATIIGKTNDGRYILGWKDGERCPQIASPRVKREDATYIDNASEFVRSVVVQSDTHAHLATASSDVMKDARMGGKIKVFVDSDDKFTGFETLTTIEGTVIGYNGSDRERICIGWKDNEPKPKDAGKIDYHLMMETIENVKDYKYCITTAHHSMCILDNQQIDQTKELESLKKQLAAWESRALDAERKYRDQPTKKPNLDRSMGLQTGDKIHLTKWAYEECDCMGTVVGFITDNMPLIGFKSEDKQPAIGTYSLPHRFPISATENPIDNYDEYVSGSYLSESTNCDKWSLLPPEKAELSEPMKIDPSQIGLKVGDRVHFTVWACAGCDMTGTIIGFDMFSLPVVGFTKDEYTATYPAYHFGDPSPVLSAFREVVDSVKDTGKYAYYHYISNSRTIDDWQLVPPTNTSQQEAGDSTHLSEQKPSEQGESKEDSLGFIGMIAAAAIGAGMSTLGKAAKPNVRVESITTEAVKESLEKAMEME
jgi:hypothetical protein